MRVINYFFIYLIKGYKFLLSPLFYNSCKFEPSCSTYCMECFEKYNFIKAEQLSKESATDIIDLTKSK